MGRPPNCFDKTVATKKGPWTPEEDIILVSYIQQHGVGSWKDIPANARLARCGKSCRLMWTNYLRPGIKRGNFTQEEEDKIIRFQALFGNKWASIAQYLPQRTDNDIKNYWNTHLRRKLNKPQGQDDQSTTNENLSIPRSVSKGQWEIRLQTDVHGAKQALHEALSLGNDNSSNINPQVMTSAAYVSSVENYARLLKKWETNTPTVTASQVISESSNSTALFTNSLPLGSLSCPSDGVPKGFDSVPSFKYVNSDVVNYQQQVQPQTQAVNDQYNYNMDLETEMELTFLEKWLADGATANMMNY